MTKYLKNKWIKALKSGDYKQTTGNLYDASLDKYCCLGVLCEISNRILFEGGCVILQKYGTTFTNSCTIPSDRLDVIGLELKKQTTLISMNDEDEKSFTEIADWIKDNL